MELLISSVDLGQGEPLDRKVTQKSLRASMRSKRPKDISFQVSRLVRERARGAAANLWRRRAFIVWRLKGTTSKKGNKSLARIPRTFFSIYCRLKGPYCTAYTAEITQHANRGKRQQQRDRTAVRPGHVFQGGRFLYLMQHLLLLL